MTFIFIVWDDGGFRGEEKKLLGKSKEKLKTFSNSQKLHKHHPLMRENAKCSVWQILVEKRHFDCIFCMFSIFYLHFMSLIIPVLAQWKPNRTFIYRYWPGSAEERIRRSIQSQSYFPVKGWTCSWHDLIIPRWLKQMSRPSRSPGSHSRRNTEIYFSGSIRNCIKGWLLELKDMFMWTWRIPVYSSIFFGYKISFQCGKNKTKQKSPSVW